MRLHGATEGQSTFMFGQKSQGPTVMYTDIRRACELNDGNLRNREAICTVYTNVIVRYKSLYYMRFKSVLKPRLPFTLRPTPSNASTSPYLITSLGSS